MSDAPGPLIALRDRRDQVIAVLTDQFSADALDVDELERRLELAQRAETVAALDALIADLPASTTTTALVPSPTTPAGGAWPARGRVIAVFGGVDKGGTWTPARQVTAVTMFGGSELDFREANLAPGVTELRIRCLFGGMTIIVPPWLAVESDATALFGGFGEVHRAPASPDPERPVLRITGLIMFGGVDIETRLPGESAKDARRRTKREAKALGGKRAELPPATARVKPPE
ncbi:MAG: DUF1707 and DUF2154 domain-containing protein [Myxococcales bacterium]|nr:DUF1707 and DUF2154 domain-containing protein [Myxococcales bacterium]